MKSDQRERTNLYKSVWQSFYFPPGLRWLCAEALAKSDFRRNLVNGVCVCVWYCKPVRKRVLSNWRSKRKLWLRSIELVGKSGHCEILEGAIFPKKFVGKKGN